MRSVIERSARPDTVDATAARTQPLTDEELSSAMKLFCVVVVGV